MDPFSKAVFGKITAAILIVAALMMGGFIIYVATILMWSAPQNITRHDAIVVLTGSKGRIEKGFSLLLEDKAPRLLISGVISDISMQDIIDMNSDGLSQTDVARIRAHCCIALDRVADSTLTNASETAKWIEDSTINSIIMVTSSEHMPRAYLLFHNALGEGVTMTPYPYRSKKRYELVMDPDFWQYAAQEYIKFIGSLLHLSTESYSS